MKTAVLEQLLAPVPDLAALEGVDADPQDPTPQPAGAPPMTAAPENPLSLGKDFLGGPTAPSQAMIKLAAAALWRHLEMQMFLIHLRVPFDITEDPESREKRAALRGVFTIEQFHRELEAEGISMRAMPSWPKVEELRRVVKRGPGKALENLVKSAAQRLAASEGNNPFPIPIPVLNESAGDDDFHLTQAELSTYFDAAISLWNEFSAAIDSL